MTNSLPTQSKIELAYTTGPLPPLGSGLYRLDDRAQDGSVIRRRYLFGSMAFGSRRVLTVEMVRPVTLDDREAPDA